MDLPDGLLTPALTWAGYLLLCPLVVWAAATADWRRVAQPRASHVYLGSCVAVLLIWQVRAGLPPGPYLHLLGATVLTLMFGWRLALVGLVAVTVGTTLNGGGGWQAFGVNALITAALPVFVTLAISRAGERLPRNPFNYILVCGFAAAAACIVAVGVAAAAVLLWVGVTNDHALYSYLMSFLLLIFPEAFVNGSLIAWLVMFYPGLVEGYQRGYGNHGG